MARKVYMVDTENVSSSWRMMLDEMTKNDVLYLFYTEHSPGIGYADFREIMDSEIQPEMISCYPGKNGLDFQLVSYLGYLLKSAGKTEYFIISNDMGYDSVIHFWAEQGYKVSRMTVYDMIQRKKARLAEQKAAQTENNEKNAEQRTDEPENSIVAANMEDSTNAQEQNPQKPKKRGRKKKQPQTEAVFTEIQPELPESMEESTDTVEADETDGRKLLEHLLAEHEDIDVDTVLEILQHGSIRQLQKIYTQMLKLFGHQTGVELYHVLKPHFHVLFTYINENVTSITEQS